MTSNFGSGLLLPFFLPQKKKTAEKNTVDGRTYLSMVEDVMAKCVLLVKNVFPDFSFHRHLLRL